MKLSAGRGLELSEGIDKLGHKPTTCTPDAPHFIIISLCQSVDVTRYTVLSREVGAKVLAADEIQAHNIRDSVFSVTYEMRSKQQLSNEHMYNHMTARR
jgi:hypothetical protein